MRYLWLGLLAGLCLGLVACRETPSPAAMATTPCQVTHVVDGDTLHLDCGGVTHKVRLLGYDTPEVYHPKCPAEKLAGDQATVRLQVLTAMAAIWPMWQSRGGMWRDTCWPRGSRGPTPGINIPIGVGFPGLEDRRLNGGPWADWPSYPFHSGRNIPQVVRRV